MYTNLNKYTIYITKEKMKTTYGILNGSLSRSCASVNSSVHKIT